MNISLPDLPYPKNALEPHISARTLEFHHDKHHNAYVNKTLDLVKGTAFENQKLEDIIEKSVSDSGLTALFNNAAQAWNHSFYWNCMKPGGGGNPSGKIAQKIDSYFGDFEKFKEEFKSAGATQFGSGWAWLVLENGDLKIMKTGNADTPVAHGLIPLLTVDVWEHAYYLDYQNRRPDYLDIFIGKLVNWDFVNKMLG